MPHKINNLSNQVIDLQNCTQAVLVGTEKLKRTPAVVRIRSNPEKYGKKIQQILINGWEPKPVRHKTINEGTLKKKRELTIPCILDHLIHVAIMLPLIPHLLQRYDYYSCGSIPNKGPSFAYKKLKEWILGDFPYEYAAEADIHKFYASCSSEIVYNSLCRIIKDSHYLNLHKKILKQMGGFIAIGFQPSHWYGNLVLTQIDNEIRQQCGNIKFVRYMDNYVLLSKDKLSLQKTIEILFQSLKKINLTLNSNWQIFPTKNRSVNFLSYRFFHNKIIMRKKTMFFLSARLKTAGRNNCVHLARGAVSRTGLLKHCDSFNYQKKWVFPYIDIIFQRRLISNADKRSSLQRTSQ